MLKNEIKTLLEESLPPTTKKPSELVLSKIRVLFKAFLDSKGINKAFEQALSPKFTPQRDQEFVTALNNIIKFCNDFKTTYDNSTPAEIQPSVREPDILDPKTHSLIKKGKIITKAKTLTPSVFTPVGLVKQTLDILRNPEYADMYEDTIKDAEDGDNDEEDADTTDTKTTTIIKNFFTKANNTFLNIQLPDAERIKQELSDLAIACNIIQWKLLYNKERKSLLTVSRSVLELDKNYLTSTEFKSLSSLTPAVLTKFLNSNTDSATYIKQLFGNSVGIRESINELDSEYVPTGALGKLRKKGDIGGKITADDLLKLEQDRINANKQLDFEDVLNARVPSSVTLDPEDVLSGEVKPHEDYGKEDIGSFIFVTTGALLWIMSDLLLDESENFNIKNVLSKAVWETQKASQDLKQGRAGEQFDDSISTVINKDIDVNADETFSSNEESPDESAYRQELKRKAYKDTITFLSTVFGVKDLSKTLGYVLSKVFINIPLTNANFSDSKFSYYKIVANGNIETVNLFSELAELAKEPDAINIELANVIYFLGFTPGIYPRNLEALITGLPKNEEAGRIAYVPGKSPRGEITTKIQTIMDVEADKINDWYSELCKKSAFFSAVSPYLTSPISDKFLAPDSPVLNKFGITIEQTVAKSKYQPGSGKQVSVNITNRSKLNDLYDEYVKIVTEILQPANRSESVWGLRNPKNFHSDKKLPRTAFPTKSDTTGVSITPTTRKSKEITVYASEAEFNSDADNIITALETKKPEFLAAKSLDELHNLLTQVVSIISPDHRDILNFSSPGTVSNLAMKQTKLRSLLDPSVAITRTLFTIQSGDPIRGGSEAVTPFFNFAKNAITLKENTELYNYIVTLIENENDLPTGKPYANQIDYAIVNMHIRAQLLLALSNFFYVIEDMLDTISRVLNILPTESLIKLKTPFNESRVTKDACNSLAKIIVNVLSDNIDIQNEVSLKKAAADLINIFNPAEDVALNIDAIKDAWSKRATR